MPYIDGFITPVPKTKRAAYKKLSTYCGKIFLEHGAIEFVECVEDDAPFGKLTSFPRAVKLKKNEVVMFSYIIYKNRKSRDACLKKVMTDPRFAKMDPKKMPFDGKRMIWGGFEPIVALKKKK